MTQSAMRLTEEITTRWDDRLVGSAACLACADYLEEKLATFCDKTENQEFMVRPGAFLGYIRINIVLFFVALLALWLQQFVLAAAIATLSVLITVLEFFFYKEFVDFLFPSKKGKNVFGTIEPEDVVKQQIIISAHHDSAHIFNFLEKDPSSYVRKIVSGTSTQLLLFISTWLLFILNGVGIQSSILYWLIVGGLTLASINLYALWFFYDKKGTPGAGDNMACTALALEIGKYFAHQKRAGKGLKHTRLMIASWDAEECGLRGARAFVKKYKADLQKIKTYNFNLECMYDHQELFFLTSDLNNFVSLSKKMVEECVEVAAELGFNAGTTLFPLLAGGTDAAEFAKAGIEATTLAAMNWKNTANYSAYHTTRDTIEAVDEEAVARSIAIGIQYVLRKERQVN